MRESLAEIHPEASLCHIFSVMLATLLNGCINFIVSADGRQGQLHAKLKGSSETGTALRCPGIYLNGS